MRQTSPPRNLKRGRKTNRYTRPSRTAVQRSGRLAAGKGTVLRFCSGLLRSTRVVLGGVLLLSFLTMLSLGLVAGYQWVLNTQYFMVKKVVIQGIKRTTRDDVLAATGLDKPTNILAVSLSDMANNLNGLSWVQEAGVRRKLPDTIMITLKERRPKTLINLGGLYYLDETGNPFRKFEPEEKPEFPIITGFTKDDFAKRPDYTRRDLQEVFRLLDALSERNDRFRLENISEVNYDPARGLSLVTRDEGVLVKLGMGEYEDKLKRLSRVLVDMKIHGEEENLLYFNLENVPRVVVRREKKG